VRAEEDTGVLGLAAGTDRDNLSQQRALAYFIGIRQTNNQYENPIKASMNRAANQFNMLNSPC